MNRFAKFFAIFAVAMLATVGASAQGFDACNCVYFEVVPSFTLDPGWCVTWTIDCTGFGPALGLGAQPYFDFDGPGPNPPLPLSGAPGMRIRWTGNITQQRARLSACNLSDSSDCPACAIVPGDADSDTVGAPNCQPAGGLQDCTGRGFIYTIQLSGYCCPACNNLRGAENLSDANSFEFYRASDMPTAGAAISGRTR